MIEYTQNWIPAVRHTCNKC